MYPKARARGGKAGSTYVGNLPVDKVSFSHPVLYNAFKRFSKGYSASERAALFHDTAVRAYRIDVFDDMERGVVHE